MANLTKHQREAISEYEKELGFEFQCLDRVRRGDWTFKDAWDHNIQWMRDLLDNIDAVYYSRQQQSTKKEAA